MFAHDIVTCIHLTIKQLMKGNYMFALNPAQQDVVDHYAAFNVPGRWFASQVLDNGAVEMLFLSAEHETLWAILIQADGSHSSSESIVEFTTGITV